MCEDLEKQYNALLHEYQKCVEKKMAPEDYQQYNEILFSAHSLGIEGNSYTINDTKALKELGLGVVPTNKPLVETMEMLDHFHAYEQMFDSTQCPLTEDYILSLHATLTHHTISYRHPGATPGEYTTMDMGAGDTLFGDHEQLIKKVPDLLQHTERTIEKGLPPMFVAAIFTGTSYIFILSETATDVWPAFCPTKSFFRQDTPSSSLHANPRRSTSVP